MGVVSQFPPPPPTLLTTPLRLEYNGLFRKKSSIYSKVKRFTCIFLRPFGTAGALKTLCGSKASCSLTGKYSQRNEISYDRFLRLLI